MENKIKYTEKEIEIIDLINTVIVDIRDQQQVWEKILRNHQLNKDKVDKLIENSSKSKEKTD